MKNIKTPVKQAKKKSQLPEFGIKVKIKNKIAPIDECGGFLVKDKHLQCRRPKEQGKYIGWVPGAGGDIWWIEHDDETVGAYTYEELTDVR